MCLCKHRKLCVDPLQADSEVESSDDPKSSSHTSNTPDNDQTSSIYEDGSAVADNEDIPREGDGGDESSSVSHRVGTIQDSGSQILSSEVHMQQWKDMLQTFFVEHLFCKTMY